MTKFEQIGINMQLCAYSKEEALRKFSHSCDVCCHKGIHIECDHCGIAATHKEVVAYFADAEKEAKS